MKLLLMSHGNLAIEALKSAEMILGPLTGVKAIGLQPSQGPEDLQCEAEQFIDIAKDESVVVMVDLLGGTPSNVVVRLLAKYPQLQVMSGLNLQMILSYENQIMLNADFDKESILKEARDGVLDVNDKLS